ncbi:hypothetical protein, partial [Nonomuraea thailandensis]
AISRRHACEQFKLVHHSRGRNPYFERRARVLHWLVDALREESVRYLAQDAEDRALDARQRAAAFATFDDFRLRTTHDHTEIL